VAQGRPTVNDLQQNLDRLRGAQGKEEMMRKRAYSMVTERCEERPIKEQKRPRNDEKVSIQYVDRADVSSGIDV